MFLDLSSVKTYFFLQIIFLNSFSLQTNVLVDPFLTSLTDTRDQLRRHTTVVPPWSTRVILGSLCTETVGLRAIMANGETLPPVKEEVNISLSSLLRQK